MNLEDQLLTRTENKCELCTAKGDLSVYVVPGRRSAGADVSIMVCEICLAQLEKREAMDNHHWRCLSGAIWSEVPAVQVASWQMLSRLARGAGSGGNVNSDAGSWAQDQLDMMYLDEDVLSWAKNGADEDHSATEEDIHKDANGALLKTGDSVVLTKSLDVKGSTLNAKMGTVVKNIRLVENNTDQIEGKIEGQVIVILTKYVRKQGA
jgi:protein PhnA